MGLTSPSEDWINSDKRSEGITGQERTSMKSETENLLLITGMPQNDIFMGMIT